MNYFVFAGGLLSLIGFAAHAIWGTKETLTTKADVNDEVIEKNWYQAFIAWHLVTANLLLSTIALFLISTTEILEDKRTVTLVIALQFLFWAVFGLATVFATGARKYFRHFYHWVYFLAVAGLLFYGMDRF